VTKRQSSLGKIEISPNAIATLVVETVLQCYGVVGLAHKTKFDDWTKTLLNIADAHRGVEIEVTDKGVVVDLYIIVEYGTRVAEVAHGVIRRVHYSLRDVAGIPLTAVHVHVQGLRVSPSTSTA